MSGPVHVEPKLGDKEEDDEVLVRFAGRKLTSDGRFFPDSDPADEIVGKFDVSIVIHIRTEYPSLVHLLTWS